MTNREILDLTQPPKTLCCIGGGVIGLEMACYFASIGVKVVVVEMLPKIAGNTDAEICDLLMKTYKKQGMEFHLSAGVREIRENAVVYADADGVHEVACDRVLLATGRRAMTQGFGLETLGVRTERGAIVTDEHMQTNVPGVYAVGDCNGRLMLAHAAYRQAEVAVHHICGVSDSVSQSVVPSVIYTTPEVACAGLNEDEARATGHNIRVARVPMLYSGRFVAENDRGDGFCKLVYDADEDRLAGVQLIGPYASEMIYGAAMMVQLRLPLEQLKRSFSRIPRSRRSSARGCSCSEPGNTKPIYIRPGVCRPPLRGVLHGGENVHFPMFTLTFYRPNFTIKPDKW